MNRPQIGPKQSCPLCHDVLRNGGALVACEACETLYHEGCFEEFGGCAVLGCKHHDATRVQPEASLAKSGGEAGARSPQHTPSVVMPVVAACVAVVGLLVGFLLPQHSRRTDAVPAPEPARSPEPAPPEPAPPDPAPPEPAPPEPEAPASLELPATISLLGSAHQEYGWFADHGWTLHGPWHWTYRPIEGTGEEVHSIAALGFDNEPARAELNVGHALRAAGLDPSEPKAWRFASGLELPSTATLELRVRRGAKGKRFGLRLRGSRVELGSYDLGDAFEVLASQDLSAAPKALSLESNGAFVLAKLEGADGASAGPDCFFAADWLGPLGEDTVFQFLVSDLGTSDHVEFKDSRLSLGTPPR